MAKLLFVLEHFHPHVGGVETLFGYLTESLTTAGHDVTVLTASMPSAPPVENRQGVRIVRLWCPQPLRRYAFTLFAIPRAIRESRRHDLIHTTTYNAAIPAWLAAKLTGKPVVITVHEVWGAQWNRLPGLNRLLGWGFRIFEWLTLHLPFDHYLAVPRHTASRLAQEMGVATSRIDVAYPPFDETFWSPDMHHPRPLKEELGIDPSRPLYLYFGRAGSRKASNTCYRPWRSSNIGQRPFSLP